VKTTIPISKEVRNKLRIYSAYLGKPYDEVLEDFMYVFENSLPFKTKSSFANWFEKNIKYFGFKKIIKKVRNSFDYILLSTNNKEVKVKLVLIDRDFEKYKTKVDLVISLFGTKSKINGTKVINILKGVGELPPIEIGGFRAHRHG